MKVPEHWPAPRWWVVRTQLFAERFIPVPLIVSASFFALPSLIAGIIIAKTVEVRLFTRGVAFALAWLAIAPWLLTRAYRTIAVFFDNNGHNFLGDEAVVKDLQHRALHDLQSPQYALLSTPLVVACTWVLLTSIYGSSPLVVRIWSVATFGVLFYLGGMGFWGIYCFNGIFERICAQRLKFDPYHADGFGGLSFLGQFNLKGPQYFFSGALLFPLVSEAVDNLPDSELISLTLWSGVFAFLAFGMAGFLIPQVKMKDMIARYKDSCLAQSEAVLQTLLGRLCSETCKDMERAQAIQLQTDAYYRYFHERIMKVREWPFDWKIILQMLSSLAPPVFVAVLEMALS